MDNPNLFVISGGPGAGKTTVLRELQALGFQTEREVARQIIQEQVQTGGTGLPWMDRRKYTELMLQRSVESFLGRISAQAPVFCDRGIPDTLCYARLIDLPELEPIETACRRYRYASVVFLAPPWREIYTMDAERKQDFAEAEKTFEVMMDVYRELGYEVVELPRLSPRPRAQFIVSRLNRPAGPLPRGHGSDTAPRAPGSGGCGLLPGTGR